MAVFGLSALHAHTEPLSHSSLDLSCVSFDNFNFNHQLHAVHVRGMVIELEDGTLWIQKDASEETKNYNLLVYGKRPYQFATEFIQEWKPGDTLIFHCYTDKEALLVYNVERSQLLDFKPLLPALQRTLAVSSLHLEDNSVTLSDGSTWLAYSVDKDKPEWEVGDPVLVAKAYSGQEDYTHVLINMHPCVCESTVEHIHPNRMNAVRLIVDAANRK